MILVTPEKIADVMALMPLPHSFAELDARVGQGLPKSALKACVARVCPGVPEQQKLLYRIVPQATFKRRRDALSVDESERAERLARVFASAAYVWDNEDDARAFLNAAHPLLQGRAPLDVAMTELGARRVEALLWQLYYGLAA